VEPLAFLHVLLGDKPVLRPSVQLYQRLLSEQIDPVRQLVREHLEVEPKHQVFESILIPALRRVDADRRSGLIENEKAHAIFAILSEVLGPPPPAESSIEFSRPLYCLPARDEADALCGRMLQHAAAARGVSIEVIDAGYFANEQADLVAENQPAAVLVSALSLDREAFLRHAVKRIRARAPNVELIAALWSGSNAEPELLTSLADATGAEIVTTFIGAIDAMRLAMARPSRSRGSTRIHDERMPAGIATA
jgi:hypothetical protein